MDILASSENNQSFYSTADFFVRFTTLSERNVLLQEEKSNVSSSRIGVKIMSSLQDSVAVYATSPAGPRVVFILFLPLLEGKIWSRLENKTPREIMSMDRKNWAQKNPVK